MREILFWYIICVGLSPIYYKSCYMFLQWRKDRILMYESHNFAGINLLKRFYMAPCDYIRITYKIIFFFFISKHNYHMIYLQRFNPMIYDLVTDKNILPKK